MSLTPHESPLGKLSKTGKSEVQASSRMTSIMAEMASCGVPLSEWDLITHGDYRCRRRIDQQRIKAEAQPQATWGGQKESVVERGHWPRTPRFRHYSSQPAETDSLVPHYA